ncbi:hypothetical protein [Nitrospirillum iridis]|uniref:Uncharacterized protein n=1 Tax=Nitrospirillum iridis TaxID=765888 RepID=A0A7X0EDM9_9PROT|nr:hypothetical protein [Nitrospirillum iridis]MBB6252270.1 hypothetical protein [Nitrospirillum iridis]
MRLSIAKCVWGARYVQTMLALNLPSLLASGNIPAAVQRMPLEHVLVTTAEDCAVIEASPVYQALAALIPCRIIPLDETPVSADYDGIIDRMNRAHVQIMADCRATGAAWVFDQPDHIWGNGSLDHLAELAQRGVRCAMFAGIRTNRQQMESVLAHWRQGNTIDIGRDALLRLSIEHMHFHDQTRFWGAPLGAMGPHHLNWRVSPHSFLRRVFYAQPFLMAVPPAAVAPGRSVDLDYVEHAYPADALHHIRSSRDFLVVEVSDRWQFKEQTRPPFTVPYLATWAGQYVSDRQMAVFDQPIRFQADDTPDRRWDRLIRHSAAVAAAVARARDLRRTQEALAGDHPLLAALLGRLLRDDTAHRRVPLFETADFLAPSTETLEAWLDLPVPQLLRQVLGRLVTSADSGTVRSLGGAPLNVRRAGDDLWVDGRAMRLVAIPGAVRLFVATDA